MPVDEFKNSEESNCGWEVEKSGSRELGTEQHNPKGLHPGVDLFRQTLTWGKESQGPLFWTRPSSIQPENNALIMKFKKHRFKEYSMCSWKKTSHSAGGKNHLTHKQNHERMGNKEIKMNCVCFLLKGSRSRWANVNGSCKGERRLQITELRNGAETQQVVRRRRCSQSGWLGSSVRRWLQITASRDSASARLSSLLPPSPINNEPG